MQPLNSGICYMRPRIPLATTSPNRGLRCVVVALPIGIRAGGVFLRRIHALNSLAWH